MGTPKKTTRKRVSSRRKVGAPTRAADSQVRQLWLAGLGAVATTGETTIGLFDGLVARGKRREPAAIAAVEKAARQARRAVDALAKEAGERSARWIDEALDRFGVRAQPRRRNILHRLGDVAEAVL